LKPNSTKSDVVRFTEEGWRSLDPLYNFWSRRWRRVIEFLRDEHWNVLKDINIDEVPKWRRFPTINYTQRIFMDILGKMLQSQVRYSTVPASPDFADISSANLAEKLLAHAWEITEMDEKKSELLAWVLATGNGSLRTYWDTDTGIQVPLAIPGPDGNLIPVNPETLQPDPTMQQPVMVDRGELGVDVLNPQLVRYPRNKSNGVMVGMLMTEDEVSQRYGEESVGNVHFTKINSQFVVDLTFASEPGIMVGGDELKRALVIEHYLPRSKWYPNGIWWTIASGSGKFMTQPSELPGGLVPITQFRWVPIPGTRIGATPLYGISFSNKMYDEISGKIQEWAIKVVPKVILKEGGGVEMGAFDDEPFQEVVAHAGGEPQIESPPEVPQHLFKMLEKNVSDMRFQGGYELKDEPMQAKGQVQGTNRMPVQERQRDETTLLEINSKPSWQHFGRVTLAYMKEFYTEGRTVSLVGPDKLHEWFFFNQEDLERLPESVHVDEVPLYAHNRQNMRDTVIGMMNSPAAQVIFSEIDEEGNFIMDKDRIETAMQATGIDVGISDLDPDVAEARNELTMIMLGMEAQVEEFQNHPMHIAEHKRALKGMRVKSGPPQFRQQLLEHMAQHQQILSDAAQAQEQSVIEREKQMRDIRETAEMQANVKEEIAKMIIEAVGEGMKGAMAEIMGTNKGENDAD
jgi:hypothetical protein